MKKILVCCGSSMITSTLALNKIKNFMAQEHIDVQFVQCKFSEVPARVVARASGRDCANRYAQ